MNEPTIDPEAQAEATAVSATDNSTPLNPAGQEPDAPAPESPTPPATPPVTKKFHFKKVLLNLPFIVNGRAVQFQGLDQNTGVLEIESGTDESNAIIIALVNADKARKGGIVRITAEQVLDLKKKLPLKPSGSSRKERLKLWQRKIPHTKPRLPVSENPAGGAASAGSRISQTDPGVVGSRGTLGGGAAVAGPAAVSANTLSIGRKSGGPTLRTPTIKKLQQKAAAK